MARTFDPIREMDRLLSEVTRTPATFAVPMDLYREGDDYTVAVDLPGVDPASIDIDVDDRTLTIRAERAAKVAKEAQWLSRERAMGTFARQLTLGHG
ncbi:Hsp20/alpha crystallin family protein, partial [Leclercia adecarboxylata]|uniref:Hsp20/alpha crystallin family protein n=1 Tax=Leclercia adecarboxylata TaxID=83655 RepID=UPI00234D9AD7|nr:Hsp20/alpha crystallin family protein [Leclercia adecarboxylata]